MGSDLGLRRWAGFGLGFWFGAGGGRFGIGMWPIVVVCLFVDSSMLSRGGGGVDSDGLIR